MNKWTFGLCTGAFLLQLAVALYLLAITHFDLLHVNQAIVTNEKLISQINNTLAETTATGTFESSISPWLQLIPVFASTNEAFKQILGLFHSIGIVLLVLLVPQAVAGLEFFRKLKCK